MINNQSEQREKINFYIPVTHLETSLHQKKLFLSPKNLIRNKPSPEIPINCNMNTLTN